MREIEDRPLTRETEREDRPLMQVREIEDRLLTGGSERADRSLM